MLLRAVKMAGFKLNASEINAGFAVFPVCGNCARVVIFGLMQPIAFFER